MSAYAIFLGPIAAIMLLDFWVVNSRRYDSLALYQPWNPVYRYVCAVPGLSETRMSGVNWRALVAFLVGVTPNLPGLINAVNPGIEVGMGIHPYQFGWLLGFFATAGVYVGLSWWFPARETRVEHAVLPDEVYADWDVVVEGLETGSLDRVQTPGRGEKSPAEEEKAV